MCLSSGNRLTTDRELAGITSLLENILNCQINVELFPIELLAHTFFQKSDGLRSAANCAAGFLSTRELANCVNHLGPICGTLDDMRRSAAAADGCALIIDWFWWRRVESMDMFHGDAKRMLSKAMPHLNRIQLEAVLSRFMAHRRCIARLKSTCGWCWESARKSCANTSTVAVKVIRVALANLEPTIQRVPDVRLIHYVRDPRAIAVSRAVNTVSTFSGVDKSAVAESKLICEVMLEDLLAKQSLERRYPEAIITVRYEDFAADAVSTAEWVFDHVGRPVPAGFCHWLSTVMNSNFKTTSSLFADPYSIYRSNSSATSVAWKSRVSPADLISMNFNCRQVLQLLGY